MRVLLFLLLFAPGFTNLSYGQQFYTDLNGFRLGQYWKAAKTELGKPFMSGKYDDGFGYEAFLIKPDTSVYMAFEYAVNDTLAIWSIQISGTYPMDIGFRNLTLGMDTTEVKKLLGKPSDIDDIGEYGKQWNYTGTNFSLEINLKGKLSSVKIRNIHGELFPDGPDISKIPSFEVVRKTLTSNDDAEISKLLLGNVEVYYQNATLSFQKSIRTELTSDYSKLFSTIKSISKDLATVNTNDPSEYEENIRFILGEDTLHVIKFNKGHQIKEIVLKYFGGQYYIFEIKAN